MVLYELKGEKGPKVGHCCLKASVSTKITDLTKAPPGQYAVQGGSVIGDLKISIDIVNDRTHTGTGCGRDCGYKTDIGRNFFMLTGHDELWNHTESTGAYAERVTICFCLRGEKGESDSRGQLIFD